MVSNNFFGSNIYLVLLTLGVAGAFRMPLAPKKKFARFNVGHFMKERKQAQEELASTNHLIEGERKKLEAAQLQLRRL